MSICTAISTRTPHAGSDQHATGRTRWRTCISTRTPHAGSDADAVAQFVGVVISTRTPHAGSDVDGLCKAARHDLFQPALPMRGVTANERNGGVPGAISTRTPHAGSDREQLHHLERHRGFQPALPMRGVTFTIRFAVRSPLFQPALPMRGVTAILCANLLLRSTYSVIRQTRYTQQARQASLCHTIWCEPHVCHMRASCSHHGPTTPRTLQLRTLVSHLHAQSSSHICFQDCRIANYLSPDRSARRARS